MSEKQSDYLSGLGTWDGLRIKKKSALEARALRIAYRRAAAARASRVNQRLLGGCKPRSLSSVARRVCTNEIAS